MVDLYLRIGHRHEVLDGVDRKGQCHRLHEDSQCGAIECLVLLIATEVDSYRVSECVPAAEPFDDVEFHLLSENLLITKMNHEFSATNDFNPKIFLFFSNLEL